MMSNSTSNSVPAILELLNTFLKPDCSEDDIVLGRLVLDMPVRKREVASPMVSSVNGSSSSISTSSEMNALEKKEIEIGRIILQSSGTWRSSKIKIEASPATIRDDLHVKSSISVALQNTDDLGEAEDNNVSSSEGVSTTTLILSDDNEDISYQQYEAASIQASSNKGHEDANKEIQFQDEEFGAHTVYKNELSVQEETNTMQHMSEQQPVDTIVAYPDNQNFLNDVEAGCSLYAGAHCEKLTEQHDEMSTLDTSEKEEDTLEIFVVPPETSEDIHSERSFDNFKHSTSTAEHSKSLKPDENSTKKNQTDSIIHESFEYYISQKYPNGKEDNTSSQKPWQGNSIYSQYLERYLERRVTDVKDSSDNTSQSGEDESDTNQEEQYSHTGEESDKTKDSCTSDPDSTIAFTKYNECSGDRDNHSSPKMGHTSRFDKAKMYNNIEPRTACEMVQDYAGDQVSPNVKKPSCELGDAEKYLQRLGKETQPDTQSIRDRMRKIRTHDEHERGKASTRVPLVAVNAPLLSRCYNFFLEEAKLRKAYGISHMYKELSQGTVQQASNMETKQCNMPHGESFSNSSVQDQGGDVECSSKNPGTYSKFPMWSQTKNMKETIQAKDKFSEVVFKLNKDRPRRSQSRKRSSDLTQRYKESGYDVSHTPAPRRSSPTRFHVRDSVVSHHERSRHETSAVPQYGLVKNHEHETKDGRLRLKIFENSERNGPRFLASPMRRSYRMKKLGDHHM